MSKNNNLYENYTSTSSLMGVDDFEKNINYSLKYFKDNFLKLLPIERDANILEVGCGYGRYLLGMSHANYTNVYGIDLSKEQVNFARDKLNLNNVELADASLWLSDVSNRYDCILAIDILEHLQLNELLEISQLIYRSLKPGGVAIFQVPNAVSPLNPIIYGDLTHIRAFTPRSLNQLVINAGFNNGIYREVVPSVIGPKSFIKKVIWMLFLRPLIALFSFLLHGSQFGGAIFSSNFIGYVKK